MQGEALYTGIFDSHAHYNDERFDADREALLASLPSQGVCGVVNAGTNVESSRQSAALAREQEIFYAAAGYHPEQAAEYTDEGMAEIFALLKEPKTVAIGEIGLDYYWPEPSREVQQRAFRLQLDAALGQHVACHRAVDPTGKQKRCPACRTHRHTAYGHHAVDIQISLFPDLTA